MEKILLLTITLIIIMTIYTLLQTPNNNRLWKPNFERNTQITLNGTQVTLTNIYDGTYTPGTTTSREHLTRTYDTTKVTQVWYVVETIAIWDGIAHTFFIFDFEDAPPLALSIEARQETHEKYNVLLGMFNQYELFYTWGTDLDFLNRRAIGLNHQLYMYPLDIEPGSGPQLLQELLTTTDQLNSHPRFYNTLTSNCTGLLADHANQIKPSLIPRFAIARYLTGFAPRLLHQLKIIPHDQPYAQIKSRYRIDEYLRDQQSNPNLSQDLRNYIKSKAPSSST